ncbi:MAG: TrkH family potassium uptake protein [Planctomycetaceae bacterium]|nr:TrkH family potassium uptake protein [Planctomycetaceae bacterium]
MNWYLLSRMLGMLGMLVGASMVFSMPWAFPICGQTETFEVRGFWSMVASFCCSLVLGGGLYLIGRKDPGTILRKEALAVVGLGWLLAGLLGALPYLFGGVERVEGVPMSFIDALFESLSGFTTTGASVLTQLEDPEMVPRCVLFWRSFTHWLGGMGIIVLFVAVLGQLGAGGKAMMRREVPGPISEAVRPRVRESAIAMWAIYVGISVVQTILLTIEGLTLYDALCHTFGTMATGGFSTFNSSVGHFQRPVIEYTIIAFMIIAGTNFSLYDIVLRNLKGKRSGPLASFAPLFRDPEYRLYLTILFVSTSVVTISLLKHQVFDSFTEAVRHATFNVVSLMTTTGFGTENFNEWPQFSKAILLVLMFIGGCAGSTGGGIKVVRFLLFFKILWLEIERAFRPNVVRPLRIGQTPIDDGVRRDVTVYFGLILVLFIGSWLLLVGIEADHHWNIDKEPSQAAKLFDCATAVAATLNNIGPGMGIVGPAENYTFFSQPAKLLLTLMMVLGRLELFALLVLIFPSFWRN